MPLIIFGLGMNERISGLLIVVLILASAYVILVSVLPSPVGEPTKAITGIECISGSSKECGIDAGQCIKGIQKCINGRWSECSGDITPRTEVFNGLDDDCDGETDEGTLPKGSSYLVLYSAQSEDDGQEVNSAEGCVSTHQTFIELQGGFPWYRWGGGYRIPNVEIPRGATISSVYLNLKGWGGVYDHVIVDIAAEDTANAEIIQKGCSYEGLGFDLSNRWENRTNAMVAWDEQFDSPFGWKTTPSLTSLVQEIVNRGDWESGNAIMFLFKCFPESTFETVTWDSLCDYPEEEHECGAILHVAYTAGGVEVCDDGTPYGQCNHSGYVCVEGELYLVGELNGNGKVDSGDIILLINYLFRNEPFPTGIPLEAGDANQDGKVDGADVIYLLDYLFRDGPSPCQQPPEGFIPTPSQPSSDRDYTEQELTELLNQYQSTT